MNGVLMSSVANLALRSLGVLQLRKQLASVRFALLTSFPQKVENTALWHSWVLDRKKLKFFLSTVEFSAKCTK